MVNSKSYEFRFFFETCRNISYDAFDHNDISGMVLLNRIGRVRLSSLGVIYHNIARHRLTFLREQRHSEHVDPVVCYQECACVCVVVEACQSKKSIKN